MAAQKAAALAYHPERGAPAKDADSGFVGLFQGVEPVPGKDGITAVPTAFIRPFGGGQEVTSSPGKLREPTAEEIMHAKLAVQNRQSRERVA